VPVRKKFRQSSKGPTFRRNQKFMNARKDKGRKKSAQGIRGGDVKQAKVMSCCGMKGGAGVWEGSNKDP